MQDEIKWLLSFQRQEELDPFVVLAFLPIEPHHRVAEIGCGPGYFSIPLAKYLLEGKLYAMDSRAEMLKVLRERLHEARLGNVEVVETSGVKPLAIGEPLDGGFLTFAAGRAGTPEELAKTVVRLLRPGGWCVAVEWLNSEAADAPPAERLVAPDKWRKVAPSAGFEFRWWRPISGKYYMALLRKRREA